MIRRRGTGRRSHAHRGTGRIRGRGRVHTHHRLVPELGYLPLGTTAHKQGRVAGENAVGGDRAFAGSRRTQVVKVFDLAVARTGLHDHVAAAGYQPVTVGTVADDHQRYYPGAHELTLPVTGDR